MKGKLFIFTLFFALTAGTVSAQDNTEKLTADEIVRKANHAALYQGTDSRGKVSMVITDKQGRTRKRELNMLRKDDGEKDEDQKYFVFFQEPADVRKMVFMVHKHAALEKEDDRWLYMPSLDLVKRIGASDKRTSFAGSDFLYEDISGRNVAEDSHELIRTDDKQYLVRNIPKNPKNAEFEYYDVYIDKSSFLPMKMEYFRKGGILYRIISSEKTENTEAEENGSRVIYPTVIQSVAKDLESGSRTEMTFSNIQYNIGLADDVFTERYLRRPPGDAMR